MSSVTAGGKGELSAAPEEGVRARSLGMEGIGNARDLGGLHTDGGKTVRRGLLLRSASLDNATEADKLRLRDHFHVTSIVDLRMNFERERFASTELEFGRTCCISVFDEERRMRERGKFGIPLDRKLSTMDMVMMGVDAGVVNGEMYIGFLESPHAKRAWSQVLRCVLEQPADEALLIHCTQGKDRTGVATMLVLAALGVREDDILADYLQTNVYNADLIEREREALRGRGVAEDRMDAYMLGLDQVYPSTLTTALDHLKETYGSVRGYLLGELSLNAADLETLQAKYLA